MKMADAVKTEDLVDSETPPEVAVDSGVERTGGTEVLKTETSSSEKGESPIQNDPGLLSSMPCLLMELKRDSPESQQASTESEKQISGKAYESDSSNPCMLSPSSSGHLADSDTLSSAEDEVSRIGTSSIAEGGDPNSETGGVTVSGARKSRRSRSESEMSSVVMAAKKNRWQVTGSEKQNGRLAKVKGQRSQKHKERIRLLRQKREAAARKKYNLLQDSSTSDSDLTCDSTTSSSDDDEEEASGSSKTITADIPAGFNRAEGTAGVTSQIQGLLDSGASWDRNCIGNVLEEAMNRFAVMQRQTEERFRMWMEKLTRLDTDEDIKQPSESHEPKLQIVSPKVSPTSPSSTILHMSSSHLHTPQNCTPYITSRQTVDIDAFPLNNNPPTTFSENGNAACEDLNHSNL
ncbi:uncharacterized protein C18orf25 homolog isoform X2 [Polypterus senegalus]|uniref:uncharacterized protein C18orf25 homolog isoform X2 n=1 Tax=Polypterus senegalus TaxID=55291 RepID=UPI001966C107|nr:uncharacterized protein C18orf25 homolog isoform X2 [Polypterus senegalus]